MTKLVLLFVLFMSLQAISAIAADDPSTLKRCFGALNAFETSINKGQSPVKPDWVRSALGWVLMNSNVSGKAPEDVRHYSGSMKDISYCESVGVSQKEIRLFLLAYHGYLPPDLFESFSECFAAFLITAPKLDQILGVQRSQSLGGLIGKSFGETATQLNYMYKTKWLTLEDVQARATKIQTSVAQLPVGSQPSAVKALSAKCGWYNIPLESVIEGARIAAP
jgi:hypothetical protein